MGVRPEQSFIVNAVIVVERYAHISDWRVANIDYNRLGTSSNWHIDGNWDSNLNRSISDPNIVIFGDGVIGEELLRFGCIVEVADGEQTSIGSHSELFFVIAQPEEHLTIFKGETWG